MDDLFDRQYNIVMENLNDQKSASDASDQQLDIKQLSEEQIDDLLFDTNEESEYFLEEATPYYEKTIKDFGDDVDTGQIAVDFDLDNPRVQEFIDNKKQQFAETVNETTWRTLRDDLIEGVDNGEGIPELADRVEDVFDDAHANRSEMIARTEVNGAANFGTHEAYTQSGVVEQKTWVAALDERTRPAHRQAHNQTVAQDKQFTVGGEKLMYPGDPSGSAGNIIQCRCTLVPVTEEDAEGSDDYYDPVTDDWKQRVDEEQKDTIEKRAEKAGISVDEWKKRNTEAMKEIIENAEPRIRISSSNLEKVLDDGRFKTQFETGTSGGQMDNDARAKFENELFGIDEDEVKERPIYGYMSNKGDDIVENQYLQGYGESVVRLKDDVRDRSTFTVGDSIGETELGQWASFSPNPVNDPDYRSVAYKSFGDFTPENIEDASSLISRGYDDYIELQIHKGVSVDDIGEVLFKSEPDSSVIEKLDDAGIDWRVIE